MVQEFQIRMRENIPSGSNGSKLGSFFLIDGALVCNPCSRSSIRLTGWQCWSIVSKSFLFNWRHLNRRCCACLFGIFDLRKLHGRCKGSRLKILRFRDFHRSWWTKFFLTLLYKCWWWWWWARLRVSHHLGGFRLAVELLGRWELSPALRQPWGCWWQSSKNDGNPLIANPFSVRKDDLVKVS